MPPIDPERLLADCDPAQLEAITAKHAPLLVLASAGSGKTRVLTRRIAWRILTGDAEATHCLALTFTRKAATELRDRLGAFGLPPSLTAGTFHAIALSQLRRRSLDLGKPVPTLLESKARLIGSILSAGQGRVRRDSTPDQREFIAQVAGEIEWAKARLINPQTYEAAAEKSGRISPRDRGRVAEVFNSYEREKRRRRLVDFEDLLADLITALREDRAFCAAQRWKFRHLFVDEYQDVTAAQITLLKLWLGERDDLFAVGDPQQAIYGWNGSDPLAIENFPREFPGANVVRLDANYRSTPQVVAVAGSVLVGQDAGPIHSPRENGLVPTVVAYDDDEAEAVAVAAAIRSAHRRGRPWSQCAVLARTNAQLSLLEQALERAQVPMHTGAGGALFARPAVRTAITQLEAHAGTAAFCAWLDDVELDATIAPVVEEEDPAPLEVASSTSSDLQALVVLGRDYLLYDPAPNGDGFLAYARQALRTESPISALDGVELLTFHRAKGLEWPVVYVTGLEDGFVPIALAKSKASLDEEERLLYVALSRAADELHCSWAKTRTFSRRVVQREPSPYLASIESVRAGLARTALANASVARQALAESRAQLDRQRAGS